MLKLSDLVKYFSLKLHELGVKSENKINSTRLKDRILETYADLTAHYEEREVLLILRQDIGGALKSGCQQKSNNRWQRSNHRFCSYLQVW